MPDTHSRAYQNNTMKKYTKTHCACGLPWEHTGKHAPHHTDNLRACPACRTMKHLPPNADVCERCATAEVRHVWKLLGIALVVYALIGWGIYKLIF